MRVAVAVDPVPGRREASIRAGATTRSTIMIAKDLVPGMGTKPFVIMKKHTFVRAWGL
jgi:hypothetical protein